MVVTFARRTSIKNVMEAQCRLFSKKVTCCLRDTYLVSKLEMGCDVATIFLKSSQIVC